MSTLNIDKEVVAMRRMSVDQLRLKFEDVFGEPTKSRHKIWMIKRIAWRMQANVEGDLSERARRRAFELANDADIRISPPRAPKGVSQQAAAQIEAPNELFPGSSLRRNYKGQAIIVRVLDSGFEYAGEHYKSLTAIAKAVTGKHWNGFHFFGLRNGAKK